MTLDPIGRGGTVVYGIGALECAADAAVLAGRIVAVPDGGAATALVVLDAKEPKVIRRAPRNMHRAGSVRSGKRHRDCHWTTGPPAAPTDVSAAQGCAGQGMTLLPTGGPAVPTRESQSARWSRVR